MGSARRSPAGGERQRDADRTRHLLLRAAAEEFAEKGRAGARVAAIAERAGVNPQLISYYFGGKDGLYAAILQGWAAEEEALADPEASLADVVAGFLAAGAREPARQRLLVRARLDEDPAAVEPEPDAPEVADLRRRQAAGEIADDLDPAFLLLVLQAAVTLPTVFPGDVKRLLGVEPTSPAYTALVEEQLRRLAHHLGGGSATEGG